MRISVSWLNQYLDPAPLPAADIASALERAGFPIEEQVDLPDGDTMLDVEITSNRGDCLAHVGLAREVAAATGRRLKLPEIPLDLHAGSGSPARADSVIGVENTAPEACPRFTARVIRGVRVGPSPAWMVTALESIGQRSINTIVDASNYVLFELGQPTHTFDLNTLAGAKLVIRWARDKEKLRALDGREHELTSGELVVADADRAVSVAGVIGGEATAVTGKTTDIVLETATWDPLAIRRASRRLNVVTDAAHRFERIVDLRTIDFAAARCAALILELAGGELLEGAVEQGQPLADPATVDLRPRRCDRILGVVIPPAQMVEHLESLGMDARFVEAEERVRCVIPPHRADLTREIDLVEEVARVHGYDSLPIEETMRIEVRPLLPRERAMRELAGALTGMGFYETITFSFVRADEADLFTPAGLKTLKVDEARRRGEPALRPSVIPSLLRCRKVNQDGGAQIPGGVRLFETASVFAQTDDGRTVENRNLALLIDAPDAQRGWRELRGVIETCARAMGGPHARVTIEPAPPVFAACQPDAHALVRLNDQHAGYLSLLTDSALSSYDLSTPVAVAEIALPALVELYPPMASVEPLPAFPAIERDLSVVVDERVCWRDVETTLRKADPPQLEEIAFVGVYRGKQVGAGRKSVTLRLRFRSPDRTLRHDEVDPHVERVVRALKETLGADLRV